MGALALALYTLVSAANAGDIKLTAADGVSLHAVEYGTGANGVVLVHDKLRSAADFAWYGEKLAGQGFHVVAVDLRGHGTSKPPETLGEADYLKMTGDVAAAVGFLRGKGATSVALVGDKLGANLSLATAAEDTAITNVIALSPVLNSGGITVAGPIEKYGKRPLLLVASVEDTMGTRTCTFLEEKAVGEKHYELLENAGVGVKMLNKAPSLEALMLAWLKGTYGDTAAAKAAAGASPAVGVDTAGIKTTGEKYGEPSKAPSTPSAPVDLDE